MIDQTTDITTKHIVKELSQELGEGLKGRFGDLGDVPFWAILIGYDGGTKMVFRTDVK